MPPPCTLLLSTVGGSPEPIVAALKHWLRDDYLLLQTLNDDLGKDFLEMGLDDREKSPLVSRNQSILAHGFAPAGDKVFAQLWDAALRLARLTDAHLPVFPRLGTPG